MTVESQTGLYSIKSCT